MKRILLLSLVILVLIPVIAIPGQNKMVKVAVASTDKSATASISNLGGRSPYFLVFDGSGKLVEVIDNPYKNASRGAGTSVVNFLSQKGITIIVAETFGYKMINAMKSKGITHYEMKGKADNTVKKILNLK